MTKLKGTVIRETEVNYRGRVLVIALEAPDNIRIKEKGRQKWFNLDLLCAYELAMKLEARRGNK